jgi:hypothetical protein
MGSINKTRLVTRPRPAKERARFPADFAVNAKEPQWQCPLKSTPSLALVIILLDFPHALEKPHFTYTATTHTKLIEIPVTKIPDRIFTTNYSTRLFEIPVTKIPDMIFISAFYKQNLLIGRGGFWAMAQN